MRFEIIFIPAGKPKILEAEDMYTKGDFTCFQLPSGLIIKYPTMHIFSVCHYHRPHLGSTRHPEVDCGTWDADVVAYAKKGE